MNGKKILLILGLILIICLSSYVLINSTTDTLSKNNEVNYSNGENSSQNILNKDKDTIIIGDEYFISQLNDIYYNPKDYTGKTIVIEGFPLSALEYTFVGRYGPGCCSDDGYAYMEYEFDEKMDLVDERDWIRVMGEIKVGNDGEMDYVYIEATSVEKLEVRGKDTATL